MKKERRTLGLIQMSLCISDYFRSHILAFSSNLDELNPGVTEWREDIGRVVKRSMVQVSSAAAHSYYNKTSSKPKLDYVIQSVI